LSETALQEFYSDLDLAIRYSVARVTIWRWARGGKFPKHIKLGENCSRWPRAEVEQWEAARAAQVSGVTPHPPAEA
jgi:prophage regulatory protein